jgi:hypothetical protein
MIASPDVGVWPSGAAGTGVVVGVVVGGVGVAGAVCPLPAQRPTNIRAIVPAGRRECFSVTKGAA